MSEIDVINPHRWPMCLQAALGGHDGTRRANLQIAADRIAMLERQVAELTERLRKEDELNDRLTTDLDAARAEVQKVRQSSEALERSGPGGSTAGICPKHGVPMIATITEQFLCAVCESARAEALLTRLTAAEAEVERMRGMVGLTSGVGLIAAERRRQVSSERYGPDHDDKHVGGELARAAAAYALPEECRRYTARNGQEDVVPLHWPWEKGARRPCSGDRVRELAKAGALIAAEIDRLTRAAAEAARKL